MSELMARRFTALGEGVRSAWQAWSRHAGTWSGELERHLAGSADRFELELRERAWLRDRDDGGSLLGR